jgi:hypothetical protein
MEQVKKQTAVEWLVEQILVDMDVYHNENDFEKNEPRKAYYNSFQSHVDLSFYVDQAKAMEKEYIEDAYNEGYNIRDSRGDLSTNPTATQYYNNTYKTNTP